MNIDLSGMRLYITGAAEQWAYGWFEPNGTWVEQVHRPREGQVDHYINRVHVVTLMGPQRA